MVVQVNQRAVSTAAEVLASIGEAKSAGRPSVFMLVSRAGRNVGLAIKLDAAKKPPPATPDNG